MNNKEQNTSWNNTPLWIRGAVIGASLWVFFLIARYFKYFYSRYTIESLGSKIKPYLYFSPPDPLLLFGVLLLLTGLGALIGFSLDYLKTSRKE